MVEMTIIRIVFAGSADNQTASIPVPSPILIECRVGLLNHARQKLVISSIHSSRSAAQLILRLRLRNLDLMVVLIKHELCHAVIGNEIYRPTNTIRHGLAIAITMIGYRPVF